MPEIIDIRIVWRGIRSGAVDNQKYSIIVEFAENSTEENESDSDCDGNEFSIQVEESVQNIRELQKTVKGGEEMEIPKPKPKKQKEFRWCPTTKVTKGKKDEV